MGFSYEEVKAKRDAIPSLYRVDPDNQDADASLSNTMRRAEIDEATADARDYVADEIVFIEVNGEIAVSHGPLTEAERRNTEARLIGDKKTTDDLAEKAGTLLRIDTTGLGAKAEADKRAKLDNRKADDEARKQMLLALQAALDAQRLIIGHMDDALAYFDRTGDIEGTMAMPGVSDAIAAWEAKNGRKFDPDDPDARKHLRDALDDFRDNAVQTEAELLKRHDRLMQAEHDPQKMNKIIENSEVDKETADRASAKFGGDVTRKIAEERGFAGKMADQNAFLSGSSTGVSQTPDFKVADGNGTSEFSRGTYTPNFNEAAAHVEPQEPVKVAEAAPQVFGAPDFLKNTIG